MASITRQIQRTGIAKKAKEVRLEAKAKKQLDAAQAPKDIDEPLSPEAEARLSELAKQIASLHRKSTGQVFELGKCLAEAKSVQPVKRYGRWLKENSGYTVRSAWSFISVHERLAKHRERLEQHAVGTTALVELAKGEPDQIEDVIRQLDEGTNLKSSLIKTLISGNKDEAEEDTDLRQLGGKSGLQKLAAAKLKSSIAEFHRLTAAVLAGVEEAVARHAGGKRIVMTTLAADVEINARHASDLFKDVVAPLVPAQHMPKANLQHEQFGLKTGWGAVQHSLYRLGGVGSWPARDEMEKWVVEVAHPALRFAVLGEPYVVAATPSAAPEADVAKPDGDVMKSAEVFVGTEADADETTPGVSDAGDLDATLNVIMAAGKPPVEARMSR